MSSPPPATHSLTASLEIQTHGNFRRRLSTTAFTNNMPPQHSDNNSDDLHSELLSHNAFFDNVVNMIPAKLYIAGHSGDDAYHPKYLKGQHKESKEARRARSKIAKREKFDPEKAETTIETKRRVQMEDVCYEMQRAAEPRPLWQAL